MPLHLRADDGIRTRDPHLGKVMRYQLRYIRAPRTTSSPVAKDDDSPPQRSGTNPSMSVRGQRILGKCQPVLVWRLGSPLGVGPVAQWESVRFTRGRSLVRSQPGPLRITAGQKSPTPYTWPLRVNAPPDRDLAANTSEVQREESTRERMTLAEHANPGC